MMLATKAATSVCRLVDQLTVPLVMLMPLTCTLEMLAVPVASIAN